MNGEICVVTGATSGIGRATAIGLAKLGARVVIVARSQSKASQLVEEISMAPGVTKPELVLADLSDMKQVCRPATKSVIAFTRLAAREDPLLWPKYKGVMILGSVTPDGYAREIASAALAGT